MLRLGCQWRFFLCECVGDLRGSSRKWIAVFSLDREDQTTHNIGKCHKIVAVVVIGRDDLKQPTATSTMFFSAGAVRDSL